MNKKDDMLSLKELIGMLLENRKLVILTTVLFTLLATAYSFTIPKVYKASVTFIEDKKNKSEFGAVAKLLGEIPFETGVSGDIDVNMIILKSRKLKDKVILNNDLYQYFSTKVVKEKNDKINIADIYIWLDKIVETNKNEKTGLYSINVKMTDRNMVVKLANGYYNELQSFMSNEIQSQKRTKLLYLQENIATVESEIKNKENELRSIEKRYNTVSLDEDAKIVVQQRAELKKKILALNSELSTAEKFYGPRSYEVQKLKNDIEEANKQVKQLEQGNAKDMKLISLGDIPDVKMAVDKIKRELEANKSVYDLLRTEFEAAKLQLVKEQNTITLIDDAIEPYWPEKSNRKFIIIIGFIIGFMLSTIIILFKGDRYA